MLICLCVHYLSTFSLVGLAASPLWVSSVGGCSVGVRRLRASFFLFPQIRSGALSVASGSLPVFWSLLLSQRALVRKYLLLCFMKTRGELDSKIFG